MGTRRMGAQPVAPGGATQHLHAAPAVDVYVTVRDASGAPLPGARVTASVDGHPLPEVTTDATGLAELHLALHGNVSVTAAFLDFVPDEMSLAFTGQTAIFVTLQPLKVHTLTHFYPWQNRVLRRTIYRDRGGHDPGQAGESRQDEHKDRKQRLWDFIRLFRGRVNNPAPAPEPPANDPSVQRLRETRRRLDDPPPNGRRRTRREADAQAASRRRIDRQLDDAARDSMTHRQMLVYILDNIFAHDDGTVLPDWVRYMVIHYSGLRYRSAHGSYYPPQWLVYNLRDKELDEGEIGADDARLQKYVGELIALFERDEVLAEAVNRRLGWYLEATNAGHRRHPHATVAVGGEHAPRHDVLARLRGSNQSTSQQRAFVQTVHTALADAWTDTLSPEGAMALLVARHQTTWLPTPLPDRVWRKIVTLTPLRNDFAVDDEWEFSGAVEDGWGRVFGDSITQAWKTQQHRDLNISCSRAVCNQITEMAGEARGVRLDGGITADAGEDTIHPQEGDDDGRTASEITGLSQSIQPVNGRRLWRPRAVHDIQPGDLIFYMGWTALTNEDAPWSIVTADTDMSFRVYPLTSADPLPGQGPAAAGPAPDHVHHFTIYPDRGDANLQTGLAEGNLLRSGSAGRDSPTPMNPVFGVAPTLLRRWPHRQVVRRHPDVELYHQHLVWTHIATVIHVTDNQIITFETNAPTGVRVRGWSSTWNAVYGRPTPSPRDLSELLNRARLVGDDAHPSLPPLDED